MKYDNETSKLSQDYYKYNILAYNTGDIKSVLPLGESL